MNKKAKFKKILLFALMFLLPLISITAATIDSNNYAEASVNLKDSIEALLINEAKTFIIQHYKNCPDVIPTEIVKSGLNNNIDICFMLAQTLLETGFGKAGIGRACSRKSLFGVERRTYKTYEEAINAYASILTTSYLVNGRTEQDLLKKYVNINGHRYAESMKYESHLRSMYKHIIDETDIHNLQEQYMKL